MASEQIPLDRIDKLKFRDGHQITSIQSIVECRPYFDPMEEHLGDWLKVTSKTRGFETLEVTYVRRDDVTGIEMKRD